MGEWLSRLICRLLTHQWAIKDPYAVIEDKPYRVWRCDRCGEERTLLRRVRNPDG